MCRLPLAEKESACFRSTSMHQWELLLLSWGSAAMLSTTVKDFSQHRGKNKPKISGLSSYFCWSIVPWVCVELVHELLQHRNFGIGDIYLQLFRWMKKCGRNITICWLCLSHFLNQICHLKKSGAICCSTQHRINVFKLCAALHPEGAVQVRILSPFAVNTPVSHQQWRISMSGMGLFGKWGCHFVYGAESTTGECHQWRQADMILGDKPTCKLQCSGLWIKRMSWNLLHFMDILCCMSLIQLYNLRGVFLAGKSGCFQPEPSNHLTGCSRLSFPSFHPFFPSVCPSSTLKATRQGSQAFCGEQHQA